MFGCFWNRCADTLKSFLYIIAIEIDNISLFKIKNFYYYKSKRHFLSICFVFLIWYVKIAGKQENFKVFEKRISVYSLNSDSGQRVRYMIEIKKSFTNICKRLKSN